jgi:hypothetical protein
VVKIIVNISDRKSTIIKARTKPVKNSTVSQFYEKHLAYSMSGAGATGCDTSWRVRRWQSKHVLSAALSNHEGGLGA